MTRPSLDEVYAYRAAVDAAVVRFLESADGDALAGDRRRSSSWGSITSSSIRN